MELYSVGKASYTRAESYRHQNHSALITIPTNLTRGTPDTLLPIQIGPMYVKSLLKRRAARNIDSFSSGLGFVMLSRPHVQSGTYSSVVTEPEPAVDASRRKRVGC